MIGSHSQRSGEKLTTARFVTPTRRFNSHENSLDLIENLRIIELQLPPTVVFVVFVKNTHAQGMVFVSLLQTPGLECAGGAHSRLLIQIEGIEDERFVLGVENAAEGFRRPIVAVAIHIGYVCDKKIAGTH